MTEPEKSNFKTTWDASRDVVYSPAGSGQIVLTQLLVRTGAIAQHFSNTTLLNTQVRS